MKTILYVVSAFISLCSVSSAITVQLSPSLVSPQPVGTSITWTAQASGTTATLDYQWSVSKQGSPFQVVKDYAFDSSFIWSPYVSEGTFTVQVIARDKVSGDTATNSAPFTISSRVTGTAAVISKTANPLVLLYSAPACAVGSSMYVAFTVGNAEVHTNRLTCNGISSMNFYMAGMTASTSHSAHHVVQTGSQLVSGPKLVFQTGAIPTSLPFPTITVNTPPNSQTASSQSVLLVDNLAPFGVNGLTETYFPVAYNLAGKVIWYYPGLTSVAQNGAYYLRPVPGGTFMVHLNDPSSSLIINQIWREIDLAGNAVRETNVTRVNEQINASGYVGCTSFSHDAIRLANGHTLIICTQEKIYPPGTQGSQTKVDIEGNGIVDLDQNLQLAWYWSAYDHLDVARTAVLNEKIVPANGFVTLVLSNRANDWLHANSLNYLPSGDVIISLRDQDWICKLNYKNGTGDGSVLWTLGQQGSFTINSTEPYPWFTHQHDAEFELGGQTLLSVYDNGNTRVAQNPGVVENSRGMALTIDETNLIATPVLSVDLGAFSQGGGSAQRLVNGDYHFLNSVLGDPTSPVSQHIEIQPTAGSTTGTVNTEMTIGTDAYRSYRMVSLYQLSGN